MAFHIGMSLTPSANSFSLSFPFLALFMVMSMKSMNATVSIAPSMRESVPSRRKMRSATDATKTIGRSRFTVILLTVSGATRETQPMISRLLKTLLPTTFPMAMSPMPALPLLIDSKAELTDTKSSGADVPMATMVSPTMNGFMCIFTAMEDAPFVIQSAPMMMAARESMSLRSRSNTVK